MKKIIFVPITIGIMFIIGCGSAALIEAPTILSVITHEASITIIWQSNTSIEDHQDFKGYNVYVSADSSELLIESAEDLNKINPTTVTDTIYTTPALLNQDTIYYIQVRAVNTDDAVGGYSDSTPFVKASPRPEFTITINFEMNALGIDDSCAVKFSDATIIADSAMANSNADMWIEDSPIDSADCVRLNSADNHTQYGAGARATNFANLGQYELDDIVSVTTDPTVNYADCLEGDLVIVITEDGNYVKIHIDMIDKVNNKVTITYAYQNIANFPSF